LREVLHSRYFLLALLAFASSKHQWKVACERDDLWEASVSWSTEGVESVTAILRSRRSGQAVLNLLGGIQLHPGDIGLFAMSQAFEGIEESSSGIPIEAKISKVLPSQECYAGDCRVAPITRLIGTFMAHTPGAGADIGAFVGYDVARSLSNIRKSSEQVVQSDFRTGSRTTE
jgi:TctA family transporter